MRLVGFSFSSPNILSDSTGRVLENPTFQSALDFLNEPFEDKSTSHSSETCFRFAWDINAFVSQLFALLLSDTEEETIKSLISSLVTTSTCKFQVPLDESDPNCNIFITYELWYVKEKGFSISNLSDHSPLSSHLRSTIYHLSQYFPSDTFDHSPSPLELEACAKLLLENIKSLNFFADNFFSPISILKPRLAKLNLPTHRDIPKTANLLALRCAKAGWQEGHQIGHFPTIYDYDLTSAYPSVLASLPDIRRGSWKRNKTSSPSPRAHFGYYHCTVTITSPISPILHIRSSEPQLISPIGTWEEWLTLSELNLISTHHLGSVQIHDSWEWIPDPSLTPRYPFASIISSLQSARQSTKENYISQHLLKGMLVGLFGYTAREGEFYNPCYFAEITSQVRCKVASFLYSHNISPIHISVDGFLSPTPVNLSPDDIAQGWKLNYTGEALVLNHTDVYFSDKKPLGFYISEVLSMIHAKPSASHWERKSPHSITIGDVHKSGKLSTLGTTILLNSTVSLTSANHDRHFPELPYSGTELLSRTYQSEPLSV